MNTRATSCITYDARPSCPHAAALKVFHDPPKLLKPQDIWCTQHSAYTFFLALPRPESARRVSSIISPLLLFLFMLYYVSPPILAQLQQVPSFLFSFYFYTVAAAIIFPFIYLFLLFLLFMLLSSVPRLIIKCSIVCLSYQKLGHCCQVT